jgi:hypothetical protein
MLSFMPLQPANVFSDYLRFVLFLMLKNLSIGSWTATVFSIHIYLSSSTYPKNKAMYDLWAGISTIV